MIADEWWQADDLSELALQDRKTQVRWLFRDLVALDGEFEQLTVDVGARTVSVQTDYIELEDVSLGCFTIRLHWRADATKPNYRILPEDERCSRSVPEACHPHVSHNMLCEGDATGPIRQALRDCRLHDFFLIVSRVLESYNSESAYVRLEDWDSELCEACGDLTEESDTAGCQRCNETFCSGCIDACPGCDDSCCSSCLEQCQHCGSHFCNSCNAQCRECNKPFCHDCLVEEICDDCEAKKLAQDCESEAQADGENSQETATEAEV